MILTTQRKQTDDRGVDIEVAVHVDLYSVNGRNFIRAIDEQIESGGGYELELTNGATVHFSNSSLSELKDQIVEAGAWPEPEPVEDDDES